MEWKIKAPCVYEILNKVNGYRYIGATNNYKERKKSHIKCLVDRTHYNKRLQKDFDKYGLENFAFSILAYAEKGLHTGIEARAILSFTNLYNVIVPHIAPTEMMVKIRAARLILDPEDRRLKNPVTDSRRRFGHRIMATAGTVARFENDFSCSIGKPMELRILAQIKKAMKKIGETL